MIKAPSLVKPGRLRLPRLRSGPQIAAAILILGLFAAMAIEPTRQLIAQRERIEGMSSDLAELERSNQRLQARIDRLQDPDYLEQRAREQIGLVRPGETMYVVMPPSKKEQRKAASRKVRESVVPAPAPPSGIQRFMDGFLAFIGVG